MNKKTISDIVNESEDEFVDAEMYSFDELDEETQEEALRLFTKYALMYMDDWGVLQESCPEDLENEYTKALIIKSIRSDDGMKFFEDGSIF